jgi:hypothetical protein
MFEFSHCCWSCTRGSVCWFMFDISVHWVLGADEVSGDVIVGDQYRTCCCWRSLNICMTVVIWSAPQLCFWSVFLFPLGFSFLFFMFADWLLLTCQFRNIHNHIIGLSVNYFLVHLNFMYWEMNCLKSWLVQRRAFNFRHLWFKIHKR